MRSFHIFRIFLCTGRPARAAAAKPYPAGTHIGLLICRCRPSALLIYLCASINGLGPSGVRLWSTLDFCRTVWELMSSKVKDRHGKDTVQAVGAFYFPGLYRSQYCRWWHLFPLGADDLRVQTIGRQPKAPRSPVGFFNILL